MLDLLCAALAGGAVVYATLVARASRETAESAEASAEEAAGSAAENALKQSALDKRLWACERAIDELASKSGLGVKRGKGDHAITGQ